MSDVILGVVLQLGLEIIPRGRSRRRPSKQINSHRACIGAAVRTHSYVRPSYEVIIGLK